MYRIAHQYCRKAPYTVNDRVVQYSSTVQGIAGRAGRGERAGQGMAVQGRAGQQNTVASMEQDRTGQYTVQCNLLK